MKRLFTIYLILISTCPSFSQIWTWEHASDGDDNKKDLDVLVDTFFVSSNVWHGSQWAGYVGRRTIYNKDLQQVYYAFESRIISIDFYSSNDGLVLREDSLLHSHVFVTHNAGETFDTLNAFFNKSDWVRDMKCFDDNTWLFSSYSDTLYITEDAGETWSLRLALHSGPLKYEFISKDTLWCQSAGPGYALSFDQGLTWQLRGPYDSGNISMFDDSYIEVERFWLNDTLEIYATDKHTVYKSEDGGYNWFEIFTTNRNIYSLKSKGDIVVVGCAAGEAPISFDRGLTWTNDEVSPYPFIRESQRFTHIGFVSNRIVLIGSDKIFFREIGVITNDKKTLNSEDITISPNPSEDKFYFNKLNQNTQIEIFDISSNPVEFEFENNSIEIKDTGTFFIKLTSNDYFNVFKVTRL